MTRINYSYGLHGYFFKYAGGIIMAIMTVILFGIAIIVILGKTEDIGFLLKFFLTSFCFVFGALSSKVAYYYLKFSSSFTKEYVFTSSGIIVREDKIEKTYSDNDIESIVFFRAIKIFEINFYTKTNKIVLMNNGGKRETSSFISLKEFLLKQPKTKVKWF